MNTNFLGGGKILENFFKQRYFKISFYLDHLCLKQKNIKN